MFKNKQTGEEGDRRQPPSFVPKKVCFESVVNPNVATSDLASPRSRIRIVKKKSVSFNEASLEERIEFEDDDESKHGRQLYWEFFAVDRCRFKDRIERMERVISPILASSHRNVVYSHRIKKSSSESSLSPLLQIEEVKLVVVKTKSEI